MLPTLPPFFFHWKLGVPPLVGVAVKVTLVFAQTGFEEAAMLTEAATNGFTVMVTGLEDAGLPETQVSLDVISQMTTSPLTGVVV